MPKLFEVEIIIRAVIVADDLADAVSVAYEQSSRIVRDDPLDDVDVVCEFKVGDRLPDSWTEACIPYGEHDDQSIAEILAAQPPVIEPDTKTIDMFAGVAS